MENSMEVRYELLGSAVSGSKIEGRWGEKGQACNPLNPCIKGWDLCFKKKTFRQVTYTNLITSRHDNRSGSYDNGRIIRKQVTSLKSGDAYLADKVSRVSKVGESSKMQEKKGDSKKVDVFTRLSQSPMRKVRTERGTNLKTSELQHQKSQKRPLQPATSDKAKKQLEVQKHMADFLNKLLTENHDFKDAYGNIIALLNDLTHLSEKDYIKTILKISKLDPNHFKLHDFGLENCIDYNSEFIAKPNIFCDQVIRVSKHSKCHFTLEDPDELLEFYHTQPLLQELKSNIKYSKILHNLPLKPSTSDHSSSTTSTPVVKMRKHFKFFKPTLSKSVKSLNNCFNQTTSPISYTSPISSTSPISPETPSKTRQSISSLLSLFKPNFIRFSRSNSEAADDTTSNTSSHDDSNYFDYDTFPRPISLSKYRKYDRHHLSFNLHPSKFIPPIANLHDDYGDDISFQQPLRSFTSEPNNINHDDLKYLDDSDEDDEENDACATDINNNNNNNNNNSKNNTKKSNNNNKDKPSRPLSSAVSSIVEDILKAEKDYVTNVENIVEGFLYRSFSVLSDDEIKKIFGNIEHVRSFSRDFLKQLQWCVEEHGVHEACLGAVFVRNHRRFDVYSEYCLNNQTSSTHLSHINKMQHFQTFFERCRRERGMIELPLQAFLLTPVQKICKYPLQLKQLYRCTPVHHNDHANLKLAIELMLSLATKINEIKRLQELKAELHKFGSIVGWKGPELSRLSHTLIHTGQLTKDLIRRNTLIYKEHIVLQHVKLQETLYKDTSSRLVSLANSFGMLERVSGKQHYWLCSNQEDKSRWLRAIKQLIN